MATAAEKMARQREAKTQALGDELDSLPENTAERRADRIAFLQQRLAALEEILALRGTEALVPVAAAMAEEGVDAIGANCGNGPDAFVEVCRRLKGASGLPVWIKPNAGLPTIEGGKAVYTMTPGEFAAYLPSLVEAGATFLGGCCGTTPEFIRALRRSAP